MATRLTTAILRDPAELDRLRGEWGELCARTAGHRPSLTPTWVLSWWRVFGDRSGRLHGLAVRDGRELVGLLLLAARRRWHRQLVPMRSFALIPSGEEQADEILSEYLGPLAAAGREVEVASELAAHLVAEKGAWDELVLPLLDGQAPAVQALEAALRARGLSCERSVPTECPFIALPRRWEDYLAAIPSDHRYVVKRSLRDFERWAGKDWSVEVVRGHGALARGKEILHQLHARRWRDGGKTGAFASTRFRQFHDLVMPELLDRGELDLRWLVAKGAPVAVSYSVIHDRRLYFYQGGRATALPKGVRPGIVLHAHAIRAAIDAGLSEYDFLGGEARYKRQLATGVRPLVDLRVSHRSVPEVARGAIEAGRALLVRARARLRPVAPGGGGEAGGAGDAAQGE